MFFYIVITLRYTPPYFHITVTWPHLSAYDMSQTRRSERSGEPPGVFYLMWRDHETSPRQTEQHILVARYAPWRDRRGEQSTPSTSQDTHCHKTYSQEAHTASARSRSAPQKHELLAAAMSNVWVDDRTHKLLTQGLLGADPETREAGGLGQEGESGL